MPKDIREFILERWNDEKIREKFFRRLYKGRNREERIEWKGKSEVEPDADFVKLLSNGLS